MKLLFNAMTSVILLATSVAAQPHAAAATFGCKNIFESAHPRLSDNLVLSIRDKPDALISHGNISLRAIEDAFETGIKTAEAKLAEITSNSAAPTYKNTIEEILVATETLELASGILGNYTILVATPELEALETKWDPPVSKFSNSIYFDAKLFARVRFLYDRRATLKLLRQEFTKLESTYKDFIGNGAELDARSKARLTAIDEEIGPLSQEFSKNQRAAAQNIVVQITDPLRLKGLPEDLVASAFKLAGLRGKANSWMFSIGASTVLKVWKTADDRKLREDLWRAYSTQTSEGLYDNRGLAIQIAHLRLERAKILGHPSYAHMALENRMAEHPDKVRDFVTKLRNGYLAGANKDAQDLKTFAADLGMTEALKPWDLYYYAEKLQRARYHVDDEAVRPYLTLEAVHQASLRVAERLYKIKFTPILNAPVWDATVRAYEVRDNRHENLLGYFYFDPFVRAGKNTGAWHSAILPAGKWNGIVRRPHLVNVLNIAPAATGRPVLITTDELKTIFHELGHGLHTLLTEVEIRDKSGTQVQRDMVELPSQLFENWGFDPDTMQTFARHFETGEVIPRALIEKIRSAKNFRVATVGLRQLNMIAIDMAWHAPDILKVQTPDDIVPFETSIGDQFRIYPATGMIASPTFSHIFTGGYAAGYYSYKWADVLVADAFEHFTAEGIFNEAVAEKFRLELLAKGGTESASVLYRNFRGRDADPEALIRREAEEQ